MANFHTPYENERDGQMEFFDNYAIPYNDDAAILVDNTDGVYNGNIFEFKLTINNLNKTLFQVIKYLSKMRVKRRIYSCHDFADRSQYNNGLCL